MVTRESLAGWADASPADDVEGIETADGVEFVCLGNAGPDASDAGDDQRDPVATDRGSATPPAGDEAGATGPDPAKDGCGRTFY